MNITICNNINCSQRFNCFRYRHPAEVHEQDCITFQPKGLGRGCYWHWPVINEESEIEPSRPESLTPDYKTWFSNRSRFYNAALNNQPLTALCWTPEEWKTTERLAFCSSPSQPVSVADFTHIHQDQYGEYTMQGDKHGPFISPTLWTRDTNGVIRFWRMERMAPHGECYRSVCGVHGGVDCPSGWTKAEPKNVGRVNETTAASQAVAEIKAEYKKKKDRKYYEQFGQVGGYKFFAPMLAHKLSDRPIDWGDGTYVYCQPKLDGIRVIATQNGLSSRQGKPFYLPHLWEALGPLFEKDPDLVLDGELYSHALKADFNTIVSLVKREKRTPEQEEKCQRLIQYHVYDIPSVNETFGERIRRANQVITRMDGPVITVPTTYIANQEGLDISYAAYLEAGYEGQMVRYDSLYEQKRSKSLLKRKEFKDEEFILLRVEEGIGNWSGFAKRAVCQLPDGREFGAGIKGNQAFARELLTTWPVYGRVTVRYFAMTPDGVPRFPVVTDWHEGAMERV